MPGFKKPMNKESVIKQARRMGKQAMTSDAAYRVEAKKAITGGAQKTTGTEVISSVNIGKNLTKKKTIKDDLIKSRDKHLAGVRDEAKVEIKSKNPLSKFTKKIEKIKETFGPKKDTQSRMTKKKKKFPDLTGDGKVTFADVLKGRGVINGKNKKKVI